MTAKRLKRPTDPIQRGKLIGDILTGQIEDRQAASEKPVKTLKNVATSVRGAAVKAGGKVPGDAK